jgi:hypothetical protein
MNSCHLAVECTRTELQRGGVRSISYWAGRRPSHQISILNNEISFFEIVYLNVGDFSQCLTFLCSRPQPKGFDNAFRSSLMRPRLAALVEMNRQLRPWRSAGDECSISVPYHFREALGEMQRWISALTRKLARQGKPNCDGDLAVEFIDPKMESHSVEAYCLRLAEVVVARREEGECGTCFRQELDFLLPAPQFEKPSSVLGVFGLQARLYRYRDSRVQLARIVEYPLSKWMLEQELRIYRNYFEPNRDRKPVQSLEMMDELSRPKADKGGGSNKTR